MEIRAKEARAQLTMNGSRVGGSFSTIHDIEITYDATITKKRFTGEKRSRADLDVNGVDFKFKTEKRDHIWMQLWSEIQDAELNGRPLPEFVFSITHSYRDGSNRTNTVALSGDLVLKLDTDSVPKDGYQVNSWSGSCSYAISSRA
jgi:hypothetical protein